MASLQKSGKYNDLPDGFLPEIPSEKTLVTYEVTKSFVNSRTGKKEWQMNLSLPPISRVKVGKSFKPVGLVGGVDINGNLIDHEIRRLDFRPNENLGLIQFYVGENNAANDQLYQYMELMSENESNPLRDTSVEVLFRKKDFKAEATKKNEQRSQKYAALDSARKYAEKPGNLKSISAIIGLNTDVEEEVLLNDLLEWVEENPEKFTLLAKDPGKDAKATLAAGLVNGAFQINSESMELQHSNGGKIMQITNADREAVLEDFSAFIKEDKNGSKTLSALQLMVEKRDKDNK